MSYNISWHRTEYIVGLIISVITFSIYCLTLCPSINFIDSGELAAVASTLGVAHPTGYPLFTVVGWIFAHLPLGMRTIHQLNMMSALFCASGLFFFFKFMILFLSEFISPGKKKSVNVEEPLKKPDILHIFIPATFTTLILGFSETYWSQATSIEVYSLHVFFLSLILFLFTKVIHVGLVQKKNYDLNNTTLRYWICLAFVFGLSFANHMTTILLGLGFLFLYFYVFGFTKRGIRLISWLMIPFLLGFSFYIYLPLRALQNPIFNWGNVIDIERFLWHFSGKVYRSWIFSSTESAVRQLNYFINSLGNEFVYFPLAFAVLGFMFLFKSRKVIFIFTLLLFLGCVLYSINYDIHDIDSYFLLAYLAIAMWIGIGASVVISHFKSFKFKIVAAIIIIISTSIPILYHYKKVDESENFIVEDYTRNILKYIDNGGIIISYQWDYFISASYYLQFVENVRPDVIIIDKELLKRSWYYNQLANHYPWLVEKSKKEISEFFTELNKFERGESYNPSTIENNYTRVIKSIIENNYSERSIYATQEIEPQYTSGYNRVPSGLAFRLYNNTRLQEIPIIDFVNCEIKNTNKYIEGIHSLYSQGYLNNAIYSNMLGRKADAISYLEKALQIKPNNEQAVYLRNQLNN